MNANLGSRLRLAALALAVAAFAAAVLEAAAAGQASTSKPAAAARSVKDLYFDSGPSEGPQAGSLPPRIGLRYKIILKDLDGDIRHVTEKYNFSTGESIRFAFESNINGYLYIYHKGASSKGVQLFPDPRINKGKNQIARFTEVTIPPRMGKDQGWFKFDAKTGKEELIILLSPKPIGDLNNLNVDDETHEVNDDGWQTVTSVTRSSQKPGARDMYFESENFEGEEDYEEPSVGYIVSQTPILIHSFTLKHVP